MTPDEIEREEWALAFREELAEFGIGQALAVAISLEEYGKDFRKADISSCPKCCAIAWLKKNNRYTPAKTR